MAHRVDPIGLFVTRSAKTISRAFDDALGRPGRHVAGVAGLGRGRGGLRDSQRTIAADLGIEGATLTHHLARMERDGLVQRDRDPQDRRALMVGLTDEGRERFGSLLTTVIAFDGQLRTGFTDAELAMLRDLLGRLVDKRGGGDPAGDDRAPSASTQQGAPA